MALTAAITYTVWIATLAVQGGLFILMLRKRLYRELPIFFAYTAYHVIRSLVLLAIKHFGSLNQYAYGYWIAEIISVLLGFAVIFEVFSNVLRPYEGLKQIGFILLRWCFVVLICVAISSSGPPAAGDNSGLIAAILAAERSVRVIQCGLMVFLFLFASTLSLSWRHYAFGIALGFGVFASVELIVVAVRAQLGPVAHHVFTLLKPASYSLATLIWATYLFAPVPETLPSADLSSRDVEEWNRAVMSLLAR